MAWAITQRRQRASSRSATPMYWPICISSWTCIGHDTTSNPRMAATASASTRPWSPSFFLSSAAFRCARFIAQPGPSAVAAPARTG